MAFGVPELVSRSAVNAEGIRTYNRTYQIISDDRAAHGINDDEYDAGTSFSIQTGIRIGTIHPTALPYAWCREIGVEQAEDGGGLQWMISPVWSDEFEMHENPLLEPARITWHTEQFQQVAWRNNANQAIVNSAGDPFDPPPMKDFSRRVARIQKNVANVPVWFLDYEDALNSGTFTVDGLSVSRGLAKLQRAEAGEWEERNGVRFRVIGFELHFSRIGWQLTNLDAGFRELDFEGEIKSTTGSINVDETRLTSSADPPPFEASDVGKQIKVKGAGEDGKDLSTTVGAFTDPATIQLSMPAKTTVANASVVIFTGQPEGEGDGIGGNLINVKNDGDQELTTAPVPLNGQEHALPNPSPDNNIFRFDDVHPFLDFSVLPLA